MGATGSKRSRGAGPVRVALVGLSESGKSHFLSQVSTTPYTIIGPTNGLETTTVYDNRCVFEFTEYGFYAINKLLDNENWWKNPLHANCDCVMLFIDANDTHSETMLARNLATRFATFQNKPGQPLKIPLVVVHNKGRPRKERRKIVKVPASAANGIARLRWTDERIDADAPFESVLSWEELQRVIDVPFLTQHFFSAVNLAQMSYGSDAEAQSLLFEWIASNVAKK